MHANSCNHAECLSSQDEVDIINLFLSVINNNHHNAYNYDDYYDEYYFS